MFRFALQSFAIVAALIGTSTVDAQESRRLQGGFQLTCAEQMDLSDRCCGADLSACDCPVRPYDGFGSQIIDYFWDLKCQNLADKMPDCVDDIPNVAISTGLFSTLVAALTAADLVGAISAPNGPFSKYYLHRMIQFDILKVKSSINVSFVLYSCLCSYRRSLCRTPR